MKSLATAVGATTARACDGCIKRRARWYCAADDAFLCQACDGSVHSANPLARRHERVRLKSASTGGKHGATSVPPPGTATWHNGFTRKARTPRGGGGSAGKKTNHQAIFHDLVPEISAEDQTENYEEEQLICQVPVLDPMVEAKTSFPLPVLMKFADMKDKDYEDNAESCPNGNFFPSDMELAEFAADVETLLGHGLETESFAMEELGLGYDSLSCGRSSSMILKVEENEDVVNTELSCDRGDVDVTPFELSFDYESHKTCEREQEEEEEEEEDDKQNVINVNISEGENETSGGGFSIKEEEEEEEEEKKKKILMLRLDYKAVISSWGSQGPPWTAGEPPELDLNNDPWPISMDEVNGAQHGRGLWGVAMGDVGREARVSRYREKRRTRLFSKKIRYEVRKLNAEKRPRMKGRFVKRSSLSALTSSFPLLTK